MKQVLTTNIVAGVRGLVGSKQTLAHLQEALQEITASILKNFTENTTNYFRMHGLVDSDGSPTAWNISAGSVYFNGEVFQVDAFVGTHGSNVPVLVLETTYRTGDPVKYSDNNEFNTHEIRKLKLQMGATGSGLVDYSALQELGQGWVTDTRLASKFLKSGDGIQLLSKVLSIGDWNMNAGASTVVPHGLGANYKKIRSVSVVIRDDSDTGYYPLDSINLVSNGLTNGTAADLDSTNITLYRFDGGLFEDTDFDSTGYNRGFVTVIYEA
jgi:hypothetical protein